MFASLAIVADMTARATRYGRKLKFGYRVHVIVRETEAEARSGTSSVIEARFGGRGHLMTPGTDCCSIRVRDSPRAD
jgi:alkanesulfonate monooxygenase SsuD/methylene tetrahydromethanopterin reductase-like flavin-dependent oxidoreductase (luciferase family)